MTRAALATLVVVFSLSEAPEAVACPERPGNIQAVPLLEPVVESLLSVSPTFSGQCERISAMPLVRVMVASLPRSEEACCRARTTVRRYPSGVMLALVEIPSPRRSEEYAELLGHEFEHIVEQLDGTELDGRPDRAEASAGGWAGAYETERAHWAGKAVAAEVQRSGAVEP